MRHTKGPAALRVRWSPPGTLRIGAWDADPEPPEPPEPPASFGRGGVGVGTRPRVGAGLRRRVGWQPLTREGSRGKYVWCELAALLGTA
ncbi:hypothetical protein SHKM778_80600 [Streptomyces sp. KM77-8]|uniref:Uncharacterized protein n=1 Tax=Streptomyces haneummycinicus TaxID=3074435 RepID=A0AAT9HWR3_9ACTN